MQSKWIEGYEGYYKITDQAEVISYCKDKNGKVLKPRLNTHGYLSVVLKGKEFGLHQLVATAFVPGKKVGLVPNHKDGNKTNCLPSNLEWVTRSENMQHAYATGLCKGRRRVAQKDKSGNVIAVFNSITEAARYTKPANMSLDSATTQIRWACNGCDYNGYSKETAYGYKWSYAN